MYSCIVVIRNKPFAKKFYGASVAGPVFKEVADKLYALHFNQEDVPSNEIVTRDSSTYLYAGAMKDMKEVLFKVHWTFLDSSAKEDWGRMYNINGRPVLRDQIVTQKRMPDVRGMGLKDVLYLLENLQVKVIARGRGKVKQQSIEPGKMLDRNREVVIELN